MESNFNKYTPQRAFQRGRKPSPRCKLEPNLNSCNTKSVKRKSNEYETDHKRIKNSKNITVDDLPIFKPTSTSAVSPKNLANQRLQNLRKRLIDTQQKAKSNNSISLPITKLRIKNNNCSVPFKNINKNINNSWTSGDSRSVQKRLEVYSRCHSATSNAKSLNQTLPSCSAATNRDDVHKLSSLNKTAPVLCGQQQTDASFSPFTFSTPVRKECKSFEDIINPFKSSEKLLSEFDNSSCSNAASDSSNLSEKMDWSPIDESIIIENVSFQKYR